MGRDDEGNSILMIDPEAGTVIEKDGLSKARWGNKSIVVAGNKVVMGPGYQSDSILIIDPEAGNVTEKGGLPKARWMARTVVGNKIVMTGDD